MATIAVHCPRCQSALVYRHGQNPKGRDRFRCRECHRVFRFSRISVDKLAKVAMPFF